MKDSEKELLEKNKNEWQFLNKLPLIWHDFKYVKKMLEKDDVYYFFVYEKEINHLFITACYDSKTKEYEIRVRVGLTEFSHIETRTTSHMFFDKISKQKLEKIILELTDFSLNTRNFFLEEKHIAEWNYQRILPPVYKSFHLFIKPETPLKITNGSYIIINYVDFSIDTDFIIYYNTFRDEFFGEARIKNIPNMTYTFDSPNIPELEKKLEKYLFNRLDEIYELAINLTDNL